MASGSLVPGNVEPLAGSAPRSVRWLLPVLSLLLTALAMCQSVYLAPRAIRVAQEFGLNQPAALRLLMQVPEWAVGVAGLAFVVFAIRQRASLHRSALLTTTALAFNVGLVVCILACLFDVVSRAG